MLEMLHKYQKVFRISTDPRAPTDWFLVPVIPFTLSLIAYIAVVQVVLPKFMENRKPYNLKNVLIVYNGCQVFVNAYLLYLAADNWYGTPKNSFWSCSSVDRTNNPRALQAIDVVYLYFLSKYTDFFDTFFFILRKKYNQVSFLHVYHHVSIPFLTWFVLKMYPGGSFILMILMNTFVHVIMYTYYMLAAMGPGIQKYLWWKKYITIIQLFFFILRKKYNQVSFLHVYHHVSIPFLTWFVLKMYPGGSFILMILMNTFVHVIMYTYYMLAAMGPGIQKYLWWKKYITIIQLVQFTVGLTHIALILVSSECNISKVMMCIYSLNGFLFLWLFGKFYITSYNQKLVKEESSTSSPVKTTADSMKKRI